MTHQPQNGPWPPAASGDPAAWAPPPGAHPGVPPGAGVPPPARLGPPPSVPSGPARIDPPPPRFRPRPGVERPRLPPRREAGEDPEEARSGRRPVFAWLLAGAAAVGAVALVVALVATLMRPADDLLAAPGDTAPLAAPPSADPESSFATSSPQQPAPGSEIPIGMDAQLPGFTIVTPPPGDWRPVDRDRDLGFAIKAPDGQSYLSIQQWKLEPSHYRDHDLTRAEVENAPHFFGTEPQRVGEPSPYWLSGSGYRLELLSQRLSWGWAGGEALFVSRYMPNTGTRVMIIAVAPSGDLDDPTSPISQKLGQISFTVP